MNVEAMLRAQLAAADDEIASLRARLAAIEESTRHPYKGPDDTDASMLRAASKRIERGFAPGGSNTTATVMRVLDAVADLLDAGHAPA